LNLEALKVSKSEAPHRFEARIDRQLTVRRT